MPMFRRHDAPPLPPPRFYIKGSYVLDVIFDREAAQDIDFFYDEACQRLSATEARDWLRQRNLPQHANIDGPHPIDDIDDCSGGGYPEFNIDRWHIRDDGNIYTLEDTEEELEYGGLCGRPLHKTRPVRLDLEWAKKTPLKVLFDPYAPAGEDGIKRVEKAIRKMKDHPQLLDEALMQKLVAICDALRRGDDVAASGRSDDDEDFEIEL